MRHGFDPNLREADLISNAIINIIYHKSGCRVGYVGVVHEGVHTGCFIIAARRLQNDPWHLPTEPTPLEGLYSDLEKTLEREGIPPKWFQMVP